jgi:DNA-binding MarR family transcriptional regulator
MNRETQIRYKYYEHLEAKRYFDSHPGSVEYVWLWNLHSLNKSPSITTISHLAQALRVSNSAASQMVDKLTNRGYAKVLTAEDKRARLIFLTASGLNRLRRLERVILWQSRKEAT